MLLVPNEDNIPPANRDPYHLNGAVNILREYRYDAIDMLFHMERNCKIHKEGVTFLAKSPLSSKIWVAAAMVTIGWIEEYESPNGSCILVFTDKGRKQVEAAKNKGHM